MAALTKTVDTDGSSGDYASLSAFEAAEQQDLTDGGGDTMTVSCYATGDAADTAYMEIDGWTLSATCTLTVQGGTGETPGTSWSATKYRLYHNNWHYAIECYEDYVYIKNLQIGNSSTGSGILCYGRGRIENCFLKISASSDQGISINANNVVVVNCICIGGAYGITAHNGGSDVYLYNNTIINTGTGFRLHTFNSQTLRNNYAGGTTTADYSYGSNESLTWDHCYSEDGTGTTTTAACSTSSGAYFTNVTAGSEDLAIGSSSSLNDNGANLSSDATYAFSVDIIGTSRGTTWCVGAYEYVASSSGTAVPKIMISMNQFAGGMQ